MTRREQALIIAAQGGDLDAFDQIVERFRKPLCAYVATIVKDYHRAQDVAQDAFVIAHRRLSSLREPRAFASWLFRIARHAAVDARRRYKNADRLVDRAAETIRQDGGQRSIAPGEEPVFDAVVRSELREMLDVAIDELTTEYGEVLALRHWQGMSCAEIGDVVGLRVQAVRVRLNRARNALRESLRDRMIGERWGP